MRALLAAIIIGGVLAGCGTTTVDPKSGERLIREFARQNGGSVISVSCPSGVRPADGTTFDCRVNIKDNGTGKEHRGSITVHITGGGKRVAILGTQDVHLN